MDQKSDKPSQKRRAILQGSLAAPVVLTVSSPTAAQVTSFGKCIANIGTQQPAGKFFEDKEFADRWLRAEVTVEQFRKNANTYAWFYKDPGYNYAYVNIDDVIKVADMQGWHKVDLVLPQKRWALVWVNESSGAPYGYIQVQKPTSSHQFTTMSCNASVNPTANRG